MKRWIPWIVALVALGWAVSKVPARPETGMATRGFGRLPVVANGRVQPFDSIARNSLMQIRNRQTVPDAKSGGTLEATPWLLEMVFDPATADTRRVFRIDHPDLKALLGLPLEADPSKDDDGKYYSWSRLESAYPKLRDQVDSARKKQSTTRTTFEQAVLKVNNAVGLYLSLQNTVQPMRTTNFAGEIAAYQASIKPGVEAFKARMGNAPFDTNALASVLQFAQRYLAMEAAESPLILPPDQPRKEGDGWLRMGDALLQASIPAPLFKHIIGDKPLPPDEVDRLMESVGTAPLHPGIARFAAMSEAYRKGDAATFNRLVAEYHGALERPFAAELAKATREMVFHRSEPFYSALVLYVVAFVLACAFWTGFSGTVRRTAWFLVVVAFAIHTAGLLTRMLLEGRPPVTNLYSSAIFIGWGAVGLGLLLEHFWKNAIGLAVGSLLGFASLVIAHMLSLSGDTMEMMRAVLDTNFWLATHVTIVTLGYASTYVAGFLAIFYVVLGVFTPMLDEKVGRSLTRMVYGIICFATLFSFTGTVLGGIWADQSWGRFWGWDPKENGALMIVLWNVLVLHARIGGIIRERGVNLAAVGGNIVTAWSWFGTNMLGVGLHAYGFTDAAFLGLLGFVVFNLVIIALGLMPTATWRSFRARGKTGGNGKAHGTHPSPAPAA
jgi:ABC-type transport system involved in cytochrome c biogenesis permease subunit